MLAQFKFFIAKESLFDPAKERILLATSGGVDSVVMADLFAAAGYQFGLAHCNFKLRGKESDEDAVFVQELAEKLSVPYYSIEFNTEEEAKKTGESIQMVARNLRYAWLSKMCQQHDFAYLATAHHTNDSIETAILNLTKGCGIRGLHGISSKKAKLIRPLLFTTKKAILAYAKKQNIAYREDSSNASVKYTRNKIRQEVVPKLEEINPTLTTTFQDNFKRFREIEQLYKQAVERLAEEGCRAENGQLFIDRAFLNQCQTPYSLLHELLNPLGFNQDQINDLIKHPQAEAGGVFTSKTHRLLRTTKDLVVETMPKRDDRPTSFRIETFSGLKPWSHPACDVSLLFELIECTPETQETLDNRNKPNIAIFGLDSIKKPLYLRRWKEGDTFQPLGMNGKHKKVSKLFKDKKINRFDREKIWILTNEDDVIMWVIGLRQDERFMEWGQYVYKVSVETKR